MAGQALPSCAPRRILIVGAAGAGKSTLARQLGARLDLPVIHLDRYFFGPGWTPLAPEARVAILRRLAAGDRWIVEGNPPARGLAHCCGCADTILVLDFHPIRCLLRAFRRRFQAAGGARPDAPPDSTESQITPGYYCWLARFRSRVRPGLLATLGESAGAARVIRFRRPSELSRWIAAPGEPLR